MWWRDSQYNALRIHAQTCDSCKEGVVLIQWQVLAQHWPLASMWSSEEHTPLPATLVVVGKGGGVIVLCLSQLVGSSALGCQSHYLTY